MRVVPTIASCVHRITNRTTGIEERCVDNAVGLDGQRQCRCVQQSEVQSKVDVLSVRPAMASEAAM